MNFTTEEAEPKLIHYGTVGGPFDKALLKFDKEGFELISLAKNAYLRILEGPVANISLYGNWTREGILYTPNGTPKLMRTSPLLTWSSEAVSAHSRSKEYSPYQGVLDLYLSNSKNHIDFPQQNIEIPTNRFKDDELTSFAFGETAEAYGYFLRQTGRMFMPIYTLDKSFVDSKEYPFVRQMWFRGFQIGSGLAGGIRGLHREYLIGAIKKND